MNQLSELLQRIIENSHRLGEIKATNRILLQQAATKLEELNQQINQAEETINQIAKMQGGLEDSEQKPEL